ncbi:hypothetical protein JTB14_022969 [Gonioctena quinquepunctata]|nr:hypothetical protein JTB14_022969 [Gonioctena quinquepunctata]
MKPIPDFVIPPRSDSGDQKLFETLPKKPCIYHETKATKEARKDQCKVWREYVGYGGELSNATKDVIPLSPSFVTLRTSIAPAYSKYN